MRNWIIAVFTASMITAVACEVSPKGRTHGVVKFSCGLMVILCLLAPIGAGILPADGLESLENKKESIYEKIVADEKEATRKVIQERFEAYIIDKGKNFGITDLRAKVSLRWSEDGYWYPVRADLFSDDDAVGVLCDVIRSELGIEEITRNGT